MQGFGQKNNANGVATDYYYGGDGSSFDISDGDQNKLGQLIAVVQDPGGLARTTRMTYTALGQVETAIDPVGSEDVDEVQQFGAADDREE